MGVMSTSAERFIATSTGLGRNPAKTGTEVVMGAEVVVDGRVGGREVVGAGVLVEEVGGR